MDLTTDDPCGMPEVVPWLAILAGAALGTLLTAGWIVRTAWAVAHNPAALDWLRR